MVSPAAGGDVAAAGEDRPAGFLADDDELDDSEEDEEEVDEETDELEDEEDEDEEQKPPAVLVGPPRVLSGSSSSPSTSLLGTATVPSPNPNGNPAAAAVPGKLNPGFNGGEAAAAPPGDVVSVPAVAAADENGGFDTPPDRKRQRTEPGSELVGEGAAAEKKPLAILEDSRRLFQRLFTDEDEIAILQGFLDFTSQRSATAAHQTHHHDTGPFYDQIKTRLQLDFNKNQLVEKLRRLKKKYRNIMNKMNTGKEYAFKSPHDQATFELSRRIWGNSIYSRGGGAGPDDDDDDDPTPQQIGDEQHGALLRVHVGAAAEALLLTPEAPVEVKVAESHIPTVMASVPNVIEETVRSCLSPLFKELLYSAVGGPIGQLPPGAPPLAGTGGFPAPGRHHHLNPVPLSVIGNPASLPSATALR
ncbi:unnamed protein product [Spirodela intermedia]|uniref:Glabrous enhancer-binding protein-like DBD domain-containing protein n=1 Tax=Spirodela intermedia TaxID=51605 RepID=A0A7I8JH49_SPIIN|nr:unnamed protein product [Spirodela intermedia]CAA6668873.1 unnamed protein product [Spirodela intermedia]